MRDVEDLADALLEGIEPGGGRAWVKSKTVEGGVPNPQELARSVVAHWCKKTKVEPYGGRLYDKLHNILPRVAEHFERELTDCSSN